MLQDFYKISHALKGLGVQRSTGECVAFFYRTQKLDEFANVRRKQQLKKRRLQSDMNRSVTYMGISSARRGDVMATTAVRATGSHSLALCHLSIHLPSACQIYAAEPAPDAEEIWVLLSGWFIAVTKCDIRHLPAKTDQNLESCIKLHHHDFVLQ